MDSLQLGPPLFALGPGALPRLPPPLSSGLPTSIIDVVPAAPLHSYLRILDWFLNVVYRIAADKSKWSEDQSVKDYKSLICNRINEVTYLPFDQPGESGTTSTGKMARIFFSYKKQCFSIALSFVPLAFESIHIHMNLSALLKIANSNERVNVEIFLS